MLLIKVSGLCKDNLHHFVGHWTRHKVQCQWRVSQVIADSHLIFGVFIYLFIYLFKFVLFYLFIYFILFYFLHLLFKD